MPVLKNGHLEWYLAESNRGHKDFQSFALPTELRYRLLLIAVQMYNAFDERCKFFCTFFKKKIKKVISCLNLTLMTSEIQERYDSDKCD
jgi:hypothetical protein